MTTNLTQPGHGPMEWTVTAPPGARRPTLPDPATTPTLSIAEAGALLGIGRSGAYRAAKNGELPTFKLGKSLRVPTAKLFTMLGLPLPTAEQRPQDLDGQ